jgi:MFS family permease
MAPFLTLCLLGFATFFCSYLRMPVMPLLAASLGADSTHIGLINGAFMVSAGLLSIPAGLAVDRFGRRAPIVAGILATALSSLLVTQCRLPLQMAAAYLLFGVGLAAFAPAMMSLVADVMPSEKLGQAYGWYTTAVYLAMSMGPATGGYLAKHAGLRQVFFISGGLLLAMALAAFLALPSSRSGHRSGLHEILAGSAELLKSRGFVACLLATVGSCIGFGVFLTFVPIYATFRGCDPAQVGIVFAAQALTNVVGRIPIGRLVDRLDRHRIVGAGLLFLAVALTAMGQAAGLPAMIVCAVILGVGMALTFTAIGALIAEQIAPVRRGLAMGMYNSCIYLGMMTGSTAMGVALKGIGYQSGFALTGGIALVTALLFMAAARRKA